jgi:hypothetical protein
MRFMLAFFLAKMRSKFFPWYLFTPYPNTHFPYMTPK